MRIGDRKTGFHTACYGGFIIRNCIYFDGVSDSRAVFFRRQFGKGKGPFIVRRQLGRRGFHSIREQPHRNGFRAETVFVFHIVPDFRYCNGERLLIPVCKSERRKINGLIILAHCSLQLVAIG